jgi:hypothetical protein
MSNTEKIKKDAFELIKFFCRKMKESKKHSVLESAANVVVGLLLSFAIQLAIYPILGTEVSINQNLIITFVFFIALFRERLCN